MSKRTRNLKVAKPISEADQAYARTMTRLMVSGAVWDLWDRIRKEQGLDQRWLAERLGKHESRVSRLLKEPGNWTIDTVADFLEAMNGRITEMEVKTYAEILASVQTARRSKEDTTALYGSDVVFRETDIAESSSPSLPLERFAVVYVDTANELDDEMPLDDARATARPSYTLDREVA